MATLGLFIIGVFFMWFVPPMNSALIFSSFPSIHFWLTVITSILSHGSWSHLLGNFIFGFPYMAMLEDYIKDTKKFLYLYFMCGIWGHIGMLVFNLIADYDSMGGIGSSGSIFGMVAYALAKQKSNKIINRMGIALLLFFIYQQSMGIYYSLTFPMGVGFAAHMGGILRGIWQAAKEARDNKVKFKR